MSKISTIFDAIKTSVGTIFSTKIVIPNPYSLVDNPSVLLKDSWGLVVSDESIGPLNTFCEYHSTRAFNIVLVKQVFRLENNVDAFETTAKAILEDAKTLKDKMTERAQLSQDSSIDKIDFTSASGLQFLRVENFDYVYMSLSFGVSYSETIQ
jgi:hypothetical protein